MKYLVHISMMTFFALMIASVVSCSSSGISHQEANAHIERTYIEAFEQGSLNGCKELMDMLNAEPNDVCEQISLKQSAIVKKIIREKAYE